MNSVVVTVIKSGSNQNSFDFYFNLIIPCIYNDFLHRNARNFTNSSLYYNIGV